MSIAVSGSPATPSDWRTPSTELDEHPVKPARVYQGDLWFDGEPLRYTVRWERPRWIRRLLAWLDAAGMHSEPGSNGRSDDRRED